MSDEPDRYRMAHWHEPSLCVKDETRGFARYLAHKAARVPMTAAQRAAIEREVREKETNRDTVG